MPTRSAAALARSAFVPARPASPVPAASAQEFSLAWLLDPISPDRFFADHWERRPLVVRRNRAGYFKQLFSLDEADRVLTTQDRRFPDITLKDASRELTSDDYTSDGEQLDVARVYRLFEDGATITLAFLDNVVPSLAQFCRSLETAFSCPCQTNVYWTPPRAQGAKWHYDTHDVFVLQIAGAKHWTLYGTPIELPLAGQEFDAAVHARGEPTLEFDLQPGDLAYIPRGVAHDARSSDATSLHITAGLLRYTWADLLLEAVAGAALRDAALRRALPPGFARPEFDRAPARARLRDLWRRAEAHLDLDAALDHFSDELTAACPPPLRGQAAQLEALGQIGPLSLAGARPGTMARWRAEGAALRIEIGDRAITIPPQAVEAARFALSHPRYRVRDLPGDLDEAGKLTLVRRLIREGLVVAQLA